MGFVTSISSWLVFIGLFVIAFLVAYNSENIFEYTELLEQEKRDELALDPKSMSTSVYVIGIATIVFLCILIFIRRGNWKLSSLNKLLTSSFKINISNSNGQNTFELLLALFFSALYIATVGLMIACEFTALESFDLIMENEQKYIENGVMQDQEAYNALLEKYTTINRLYSGVIIIAVISLIPIFGGIINVFSKEKKIITPVKGK